VCIFSDIYNVILILSFRCLCAETVDHVAPIEPTVDEAFLLLKDLIYTKGLNVSVYDQQVAQVERIHT